MGRLGSAPSWQLTGRAEISDPIPSADPPVHSNRGNIGGRVATLEISSVETITSLRDNGWAADSAARVARAAATVGFTENMRLKS